MNSVEGSDVQSDVQSNQPRCHSCGEYGHSRRSHRTCHLNPVNNGNELDNENTNISVNKDCAIFSCNIIPKRHSLGRMDQQCSQCHAYMWIAEHASHSSVRNPVFNLCCHQGRVQLPQLRRTPVEISTLLRGSGDRSNDAYNFRIHGAVHHRIGSLFPNNNTATPAFAQIYVYDSTTELQNHQAVASTSLNSEILQQLQNIMDRVNPFVQSFKQMAEISRNGELESVQMIIRAENTPDARRYNRPTESEIGVLIIENNGESVSNNHDIVVRTRPNSLQHINEAHRHYDALHYVLIFPKGDEGWTISSHSNNETITVMQWYKYRFMFRGNHDENELHYFRKLFQQYIVDMYAKMESNHLLYIPLNQSRLRSDLYSNVADAVLLGDNDMSNVGRRYILPSSFTGSPRHIQQLYQDAMSIVRRFGKPDLFITFTCNPSWPEIQNALLPGQSAPDRPDITSRIFRLKLKQLMHDLTKDMVLGTVVGYVHTVEFQKRAELPDAQLYPSAQATVVHHMIHGPCGLLNPTSVYMDAGVCKKRYPKQFTPETVLNEDGYPAYRRRNNQDTIVKQRVTLDNRWVVPHNLYLCAKNNNDEFHEIRSYLDARYVSASEGCWRFFSFNLHQEFPNHQRLAVHLPDKQYVQLNEEEDPTIVTGRAHETTLTAWFLINAEDAAARAVLYPNFPENYVFVKFTRRWKIRERGHGVTIGRIYAVSPCDVEKYHLRMFLYHVPGATRFEDLRTVDGELLPTFQATACRRGIVTNQEEWDICLQQASLHEMPSVLRQLFVIILAFCNPSNPYLLWETHRNVLSEDFLHAARNKLNNPDLEPSDAIYNQTLLAIENIMVELSSSLAQFDGFVLPQDPQTNAAQPEPRVFQLHRQIARQLELTPVTPRAFNNDQQATYNAIITVTARYNDIRYNDISI
ncbi:hypothetical protein INT45_011464 [Circinella minor]|uniref:Helitron helicase-like domain-containing protein n=1 Tax=Circinella minor TaxID=1195481 RepID=A0A8H7V8T0_9FUNG|nr:hypothetical protein INT45_011464 [Circinella minor]